MDISMFLDSFSWEVLFLLLSGVIIGIIGGALPGISSTTTAAMNMYYSGKPPIETRMDRLVSIF